MKLRLTTTAYELPAQRRMVENLLHYAGEVLHQRGPGYLLSQVMLGSEQILNSPGSA